MLNNTEKEDDKMMKKSIAFMLSTALFCSLCANAYATRRRQVLSEQEEEAIENGKVS